MCFDLDSHPPIPALAGAAIDSRRLELQAPDGGRVFAFLAEAPHASGAGVVILPDVRGLHPYYEELALRFAEADVDAIAIDYFGRTAPDDDRGEAFAYMPHVDRTTWPELRADAAAAAERLRAERGVRATFSIGFCFGGRLSFVLASAPEARLAGVIGFYGWPTGPGREGVPAPAEIASQLRTPVLGIFGGADTGITTEVVATFEQALGDAGVEHTIVTYPGAPHSFFDRKQEQFADASAAAWGEVLAFILRHTPGG